jgi:AcrR family transcriptional regulator
MNVSSAGRDRDALVAAAVRVLNADPGASMARIAEAAGVGRATLHRRFASREALVEAIGVLGLDLWEASLRASGALEATGGDDRDAHRAALDELVERYVADAEACSFALTSHELLAFPDLVARSRELVALEAAFLGSAQRVGLLRDDLAPEWIDHVLFGLLVAARDAIRDGYVAQRDATALVRRTLLEGTGA